MMKFSVIILVYNAKWNDIKGTLLSVIKQTILNYEIVIADDGSKNDYSYKIKDICEHEQFYNLKIVRAEKNQGTIKNFIDALRVADGEFVKGIGAGDLLYNNNTLEEVFNKMKSNKEKVLFGKVKGFIKDEEEYNIFDFQTPLDLSCYTKYNSKIIQKHLIEYQDPIGGVALFFDKSYFLNKLIEVESIMKYCEDLITAQISLEKQKIVFLDEFLMIYQSTTGVSVNASERLLEDRRSYWNYLLKCYPNNNYVKKGLALINADYIKNSVLRKILKIVINPMYMLFYFFARRNRIKESKEFKGFELKSLFSD